MARARLGTSATGRCSRAPAEDLTATAERGALRWRGTIRPWQPAASALRARAPRLWGSSTPSMARKNGVGAAASLGVDQGAGDGLDLDPAAPGQVEEVAEGCPAGAGGEQDPVHGAAGAEGLDDRAAALDQDPALAGADGLPCRLELVATAGLLGPAGAGAGAALLGRGLRPADLSPTALVLTTGPGRAGSPVALTAARPTPVAAG